MRTVSLPVPQRPRPPRPQGFLRSLVASGAAHGGLLGAGVLFGVVFAGGGREPVSREYVASFQLGPLEPAFEEPAEPLEVTEVTEVREASEPELVATEEWGESTPLADEAPAEPARLRSTDWLAERPFLAGEVRRAAPARSAEPVVSAPGGEPAPRPVAEEPPELAAEGPVEARVVEPVAVHRPAPVYPRLARRAGEEGSVLCRLHLTAEGAVERVEVLESSGSERLDEAARETLATWRFEPRREDGRAVAGTHLHRVTFRLDA